MLVNTTVLTALLPCLLQKFALFKLLTLYAEKLLYFCFWRARTTIQKDDDFSITGHVVFDSRMPNGITSAELAAEIMTDKIKAMPTELSIRQYINDHTPICPWKQS